MNTKQCSLNSTTHNLRLNVFSFGILNNHLFASTVTFHVQDIEPKVFLNDSKLCKQPLKDFLDNS